MFAMLLVVVFNTLAIGGTIAAFYYILAVLPARLRKTFVDFAANHGLGYDPKNRVVSYRGLLKGNPSNIVTGVDKDTKNKVDLFHYIHVVGSGKNRRVYNRTVLALNIKKTNVHIFVNSKINDATEQVGLESSQRYSAEGDFGKYFDIYSADGKNIESLSIFAPDAMSFVMAECGFYDLEIVGDILYIYDYNLLNNVQELEKLYALGHRLVKVLNDNAPKALNMQSAAGNPDASAITSLKMSKFKLIYIPFIAFFYGIVLYGRTSDSDEMPIIFPILFIGIFALAIFGVIKNQRMKKNYLSDRQKFFDENVKKTK